MGVNTPTSWISGFQVESVNVELSQAVSSRAALHGAARGTSLAQSPSPFPRPALPVSAQEKGKETKGPLQPQQLHSSCIEVAKPPPLFFFGLIMTNLTVAPKPSWQRTHPQAPPPTTDSDLVAWLPSLVTSYHQACPFGPLCSLRSLQTPVSSDLLGLSFYLGR